MCDFGHFNGMFRLTNRLALCTDAGVASQCNGERVMSNTRWLVACYEFYTRYFARKELKLASYGFGIPQWHLIGVGGAQAVLSVRLVFGFRSGPCKFNTLSEELCWILITSTRWHRCTCWMILVVISIVSVRPLHLGVYDVFDYLDIPLSFE